MKIIFSSIKNNDIFETDFAHLSSQNGTIEFKHMQGSGGIAVIYAPNGTGKTSLANLLDVEVSTEKNSFVASDDQGNTITPETMAFHVIQDQLNRNVIRGKTTDYLIGAQIRREYELRDQINAAFRNAYEQLSSKYKAEFKVSKVGDYLLTQIESVQDTTHQTAFQYIRSIVNTRQHGKDIDAIIVFAVGYCMVYSFQKDLIEKNRRNKRKEPKKNLSRKHKYRWKNKDYQLIGWLLIIVAIVFYGAYVNWQGIQNAQKQELFLTTRIDNDTYIVVMTDGDEAILEKDRTGKDGKLKICKDKYMKVDCKNLLLEKKKYRRASGDGE